jgi:glycosyltransferase involved in cell wall biosynthesis
MKKTIWLVNYYAMPPEHESRLRTIKFAYYLNTLGYQTKIISSGFLHNKNIDLCQPGKSYTECDYDGLEFIHLKTLKYENTGGLLRFISLFLFHFKLHFIAKNFNKPDYIIHTCLPPFGNITYYTAKKLKAKYIAEVLDLWPESFVTFGLIGKNNPLLSLLYKAERHIYSKAYAVVFSMQGGKDYLEQKNWLKSQGGTIDDKKVFYINNGVDLKDFEDYLKTYTFKDQDLDNDGIFKIIYLGSVRRANNVLKLIKASEHLKPYKDIKILIYGDGDERKMLEEYIKTNAIENVIFKDKWVKPIYVPYILSKSQLNLLNYFPNPIFKYGGSQSKSFQYMASGKPICCNLLMGYDPIVKYQLGISKEFNTDKEYAEAMKFFYDLDKEEYLKMCVNAKTAAQQYDYPVLVNKLVQILN